MTDQIEVVSGLTRYPVLDASGKIDASHLPSSGGTPAGVSIVRAFPFAFNTPGLAAGAALYTPAVGDILLNAWIEVITAWNGTTPKGDFGLGGNGLYAWASGTALSLTSADGDAGGLTYGQQAAPDWVNGNGGDRLPPGRFTAANPVSVWVTTTGWAGGGNPGSTQGAAVLYLVTATPA